MGEMLCIIGWDADGLVVSMLFLDLRDRDIMGEMLAIIGWDACLGDVSLLGLEFRAKMGGLKVGRELYVCCCCVVVIASSIKFPYMSKVKFTNSSPGGVLFVGCDDLSSTAILFLSCDSRSVSIPLRSVFSLPRVTARERIMLASLTLGVTTLALRGLTLDRGGTNRWGGPMLVPPTFTIGGVGDESGPTLL